MQGAGGGGPPRAKSGPPARRFLAATGRRPGERSEQGLGGGPQAQPRNADRTPPYLALDARVGTPCVWVFSPALALTSIRLSPLLNGARLSVVVSIVPPPASLVVV